MTPQRQTQRPSHQYRPMSRVFIGIIITFMVLGAIIWILNLENIVTGPWSGILGVMFTFLSSIFGLLQWYLQHASEIPAPSSSPSPLPPVHTTLQLPQSQRSTGSGTPRGKGELIVHANSRLRGATVRLYRGIDRINPKTAAAANVVKREERGTTLYACVFPFLEPGDYTASLDAKPLLAPVTIHAGHVAEIDWR